MTTDLWKLPDILIVTLKRFTVEGGQIDKINELVTFPLTAFNVSDWVPH